MTSKKFRVFYFLIVSIFVALSPVYASIDNSDLSVQVVDAQAGDFSEYIISFSTSVGEYAKINNGELLLTLPKDFGIDSLLHAEVVDDYAQIDYSVRKIELADQSVSIFLHREKLNDSGNVYPTDTLAPIHVDLHLSVIHNPSQAGEYNLSLAGLHVNQKIIFGPFLSDPFEIQFSGDPDLFFVEHSLLPDAIFVNEQFDVSFQIQTEALSGFIDSTRIAFLITDPSTGTEIGEVYKGLVEISSSLNGLFTYSDISGLLNGFDDYADGFYPIQFEYELFGNDTIYTINSPVIDSLYIYKKLDMSLVIGSLTPQIVYAGTNVSFEFEIGLLGDVTYHYHIASSQFTLYDDSYSTTTNLLLDSDSLYPGINKLRSAAISIQTNQLGSRLLAES